MRNLYVAMTRGTGMNEAFMVVTGEQTAVDVFAQCLALDWVDLPAHTRQAELNNQPAHRPGVLDGGQLRDLFEHRQRIETVLAGAKGRVLSVPGGIRQAEGERANAISNIEPRRRGDGGGTEGDRPIRPALAPAQAHQRDP